MTDQLNKSHKRPFAEGFVHKCKASMWIQGWSKS